MDPVKTYHKMTVDEFQKIFGDWVSLLRHNRTKFITTLNGASLGFFAHL